VITRSYPAALDVLRILSGRAVSPDAEEAGALCTPHSSGHVLRIPFGPGVARMRRTGGLDAEERVSRPW
jgi:hypothetical protein